MNSVSFCWSEEYNFIGVMFFEIKPFERGGMITGWYIYYSSLVVYNWSGYSLFIATNITTIGLQVTANMRRLGVTANQASRGSNEEGGFIWNVFSW